MTHMIAAHVQHCKMHMCAVPAHVLSPYDGAMGRGSGTEVKSVAIAAISRWRDRVLSAKKWNASEWAKRASVAATTITRGMAPDATSTVKIENLHALAEAAGVPSPLDYLASGNQPTQRAVLPPVEALEVIFDELAAEMAGARVPESSLRPAGRALELALRLVSENPAIHANPDAVRAVVRTASARLPQTTPEA